MRLLVPLAMSAFFGCVAMVFGIKLFAVWSDDVISAGSIPAVARGQHAAKSIGSGKLFQARPLDAYKSIVQRPLFFHDRRFPKPRSVVQRKPPSVPLQIAKPNPPPPPVFSGVLHGVILSGSVRKVLISSNGKVAKWYSENQIVNGWRVTAITARAVHLRAHQARQIVKLRGDKH